MRVLTVDDHALFRRCMVDFLSAQADIEVVAEASSPQQGEILACELRPDVALVDLDLGGHNGMELAEKIIGCCTDCAVVILTAYQDQEQMLRAVRIGARGYLSKDIAPNELVQQLRKVMQGDMLYPQDFLFTQLKSNLHKNVKKTDTLDRSLTPREVEVLQLVTDGLTDKEAAVKLEVSEHTIKNHMKSVRRKLDASNRVQATLTGIKLGIVKKSGLGISSLKTGKEL